MLVIAYLLLAGLAVAGDYPLYYEQFDQKVYSLIIFKNSTTASYLYRINRDDGTTGFFYDPQATWGRYPINDEQTVRPSLCIRTSKYSLDYFEEGSNLIEIDKMGPQGKYVPVQNESK